MSKLIDVYGRIDHLRSELTTALEQAGPDYDFSKAVILGDGDTAARVEKVKQMNTELVDLNQEAIALQAEKTAFDEMREGLVSLGDIDRRPLPGSSSYSLPDHRIVGKSFGEMFVASQAYKGYQAGSQGGPVATFDIDPKAALFSTSAGWAPESLRTGHVEYIATRPAPYVVNYFPEYATTQAVVKYMEETTFTNTAAETAEGGAYNQATLVLTERSQTVRKLTVWLPVTDEQLEDETEVRSYIDNRLVFMLQQRVDSQLLVGDGIAPNILGTENVSGIQTQALGTDPVFDAALKLFTLIRSNGFAEPSVAFLAPSRFQTLALTRTSDGLYIMGNPTDPTPKTLWGVPLAQTVAGTATKLTAGDYTNFAGLYVRRGVDVQVGYNNDDFTKGQLSIRADVRIAAVAFRPKAFGTVTGL